MELLNVLPGPMEVKRGRFYLIDLYLMVIWDVVCCFEQQVGHVTYGVATGAFYKVVHLDQ